MMAVGKNKKRKRSEGDANSCSEDECVGGDDKDSLDAAAQETEMIADIGTAIISSSEESSRKATRMVSFSGIGTDHDAERCDGDGNEKGEDGRTISGDQSNAEAGAVCGICLSEGTELDRGKLDCCSHFFCFVCIMEWAKVESRCPLCKQRFVTIVKPSTADSTTRSRGRMIRIPTRNQVYVPSQEDGPVDPYANTVCMECLESGTEALLLLCDGCDSAAHTYCIGLESSVPTGDWYCRSCKSVFADEASSDSSGSHHGSASSHDGGIEESELSEDSSFAEASRVLPRNSRLAKRACLSNGSLLQRSGWRRTRRPMPTGRAGNGHVVYTEFAVREPLPPSRLLPSSSASARTLTWQRQLRDRIQRMRENWNGIRSGSVGFGETKHLAPAPAPAPSPSNSPLSLPSDVNHSNHRTLSNSSGSCNVQFLRASSTQMKLKSDVDKAWSMLEQAKALIDASGASTQRTAGEPTARHRQRNSRAASFADTSARQSPNRFLFKDNPMLKSNSFGSSSSVARAKAGKSLRDESPLSSKSKDMKIISNDIFPGDAGKSDHTRNKFGADAHFSESDGKAKSTIPPTNKQTQASNHCRGTVLPTGASAFDTGSYTFDDLSIPSSCNMKTGLEYTGNRSSHYFKNQQCSMGSNFIKSPLTLFSNSATPCARGDKLSSIPLALQNSSGVKRDEISSERSVHHKKSEQALADSQRHVVHARNEQQSEEKSTSKPRNTFNKTGENSPQREAVKDRVLKIISQILTPLLKSHKIGRERYKEVARSTTHHILAACGLDHKKKLVHSVEAPSCSHVSGNVSSDVLDRFCSRCLNEQVRRVLVTLIDGIEAPLIEQ